MTRPIKDNLCIKASSIYHIPHECSKEYAGVSQDHRNQMNETYSLRHTYLGQPGKLAVAACIMDNIHSKMPQLMYI
jgi:hypothetical protein